MSRKCPFLGFGGPLGVTRGQEGQNHHSLLAPFLWQITFLRNLKMAENINSQGHTFMCECIYSIKAHVLVNYFCLIFIQIKIISGCLECKNENVLFSINAFFSQKPEVLLRTRIPRGALSCSNVYIFYKTTCANENAHFWGFGGPPGGHEGSRGSESSQFQHTLWIDCASFKKIS